MAAPAGELLVKISADIAEFTSATRKATREAESFKTRMVGIGQTIAAAATTSFFAVMIKDGIRAQAMLDDMSEKTALTVETLSSLEKTARIGGHSFDSIAAGATKFARSVALAQGGNQQLAASFKALGFSQEDLRSKKFDELYVDFAKKIATAENQTYAIAYATQLAGKSAAEAIPFWRDLAATGLEQAHVTAKMAAEAERAEMEYRRTMVMFHEQQTHLANEFIPTIIRFAQETRDGVEIFGSFASALFNIGIATNPLNSVGEQIKMIRDELEHIDRVKGAFFQIPGIIAMTSGGITVGPTEGREERARKRLQYFLSSQRRDALAGRTGPEFMDARDLRPGAEALKGRLRLAAPGDEGILKRQNAALQQMEEKKKALFNLNEQELMQGRITVGSYKEFDAASKKRLMGIAREIDLRGEHIQRIEIASKNFAIENEAIERGADLFREYAMANRQLTDQMSFETSLIGRASTEQERMNALRKIDLDLAERKRQIGNTFGEDVGRAMIAISDAEREAARQREAVNLGLSVQQQERRNEAVRISIDQTRFETSAMGMSARELEKVNALRQMEVQLYGRVLTEQERSILLTEKDIEARRRLIEAIEERQEKEREWATGASRATREYADDAMNAAKNVEAAFRNSFSSLEDALVKFATTGKMSFRSFADSVIADIARIYVRQKITGPLAEGLGGILEGGLSSIFGAGDSIAGGTFAEAFAGGIIPMASGGAGRVSGPTLFYSKGGEDFAFSGEGKRFGGGGGGGDVNINVSVQALDPRTAAQVLEANAGTIMAVYRKAANARGREAFR